MTEILFSIPEQMNGSHYHRLLVPSASITEAGYQTARCPDLAFVSESELKSFGAIIVNRLATEAIDPNVFDLVCRHIYNAKNAGVRFIVDMDDHWNIPPDHPDYNLQVELNIADRIKTTMALADEIWVSTPSLLRQIRNQNMPVPLRLLPNGISSYDNQFSSTPFKEASPLLRIGVFAQSKHHFDVARLANGIDKLKKVDGWQLVCVGVHPDNEKWVRHYLRMQDDPRITFRQWLPATEYATHFQHIDVLMAPLEHTLFNTYRSNLKLAECAYTDTPIWCEAWGPYTGSGHTVLNWEFLFTQLRGMLRKGMDVAKELAQNIPSKEKHSATATETDRIGYLNELLKSENR